MPVTIDGIKGVRLPYRLRYDSTIYEYDPGGLLTTSRLHTGEIYNISNLDTVYVEGIAGKGGDEISTHYQLQTFTPATGFNFRCYVCPIINGEPTLEWRSAILDVDYSVSNKTVTWKQSTNTMYKAIRTDELFISKTIDIKPNAGFICFDVTGKEYKENATSNDI